MGRLGVEDDVAGVPGRKRRKQPLAGIDGGVEPNRGVGGWIGEGAGGRHAGEKVGLEGVHGRDEGNRFRFGL